MTDRSASDEWIDVCTVQELEPGEAVRVDHDPPIAVFNVDGDFLATADTCTHEVSSLADGYIDGDIVECAFHFAKFCLRTGRVLAYPATEPLTTFDVRVSGDQVQVDPTPRQRHGQ